MNREQTGTQNTWQKVELGDDVVAYLEVVPHGGREEVGVLDAIPFDQVTGSLGRIAGSIGNVIEKAGPSKASVELGFEFGIEEGKLVAMIARGSGKASLNTRKGDGGSKYYFPRHLYPASMLRSS